MRFLKNIERGFSLVEIMIVVSLIAILSVIAVTTYTGIQKRARDSKRLEDIHQISQGLFLYFQKNKYYPPSGNVNVAGWACGLTISPWSNCNLLQSSLSEFMTNIPYDPSDDVVAGGNTNCTSKPCYMYQTQNPDHSTFCLCAKLENSSSPQVPAACSGTWSSANYCVTQTAN